MDLQLAVSVTLLVYVHTATYFAAAKCSLGCLAFWLDGSENQFVFFLFLIGGLFTIDFPAHLQRQRSGDI